MKIAIGTDNSGLDLKNTVKQHLIDVGHEVMDLGMLDENDTSMFYYEAAQHVCEAIQQGRAERGILICRTGGGMNIVANKYRGIYALIAESPYTAKMAAVVNGCNVLVMGAGIVAGYMGCEMADEFLAHEQGDIFPPERRAFGKVLSQGIFDTEDRNLK